MTNFGQILVSLWVVSTSFAHIQLYINHKGLWFLSERLLSKKLIIMAPKVFHRAWKFKSRLIQIDFEFFHSVFTLITLYYLPWSPYSFRLPSISTPDCWQLCLTYFRLVLICKFNWSKWPLNALWTSSVSVLDWLVPF